MKVIRSIDDIKFEITKIKQIISEKVKLENTISAERHILLEEITTLQNEIKKAEEKEFDNFVHTYMLEHFGIKDRHVGNASFLVFNEYGQYLRTVYRGVDFKYNEDLEVQLLAARESAHSASSWYNRQAGFYELDFKEQLKHLTWKFDDKGIITNS